MGYIRERYDLFNSIEIREHMDCRHKEEGARCEKRKRTPEEMKRANQRRKEEKARRSLDSLCARGCRKESHALWAAARSPLRKSHWLFLRALRTPCRGSKL